MEKIGLDGKTNFFEQRVSEYRRSTTTPSSSTDNLFTTFNLELETF
jgi:hypothetical protein